MIEGQPKQPVAREWVEKLRVTDQRAREGAAFCWENATSIEALNMGDKFWAIHCDIVALVGAAADDSAQPPLENETRVRLQRAGSAIASRESVALLRLLTSASLMRITIKERATFLTKTTDWERLEDAMKCAEKVLADYTQNGEHSNTPTKTL